MAVTTPEQGNPKLAADPMADPQMTPAYILTLITTIVGLFVSQGLITNHTEKLVTGLASGLVPLAILAVHAFVKSRAHTAKLSLRTARLLQSRVVAPAAAPAPLLGQPPTGGPTGVVPPPG